MDWLDALRGRYDSILDVPAMGDRAWVGWIPENKAPAAGDPVVCCVHGGEKPDYAYEGIEHTDALATFCVYAATLAEAKSVSRLIQAGMEAGPLTVGADENVRLFRGRFIVTGSTRGTEGQFVFQALTPYTATFNE